MDFYHKKKYFQFTVGALIDTELCRIHSTSKSNECKRKGKRFCENNVPNFYIQNYWQRCILCKCNEYFNHALF